MIPTYALVYFSIIIGLPWTFKKLLARWHIKVQVLMNWNDTIG